MTTLNATRKLTPLKTDGYQLTPQNVIEIRLRHQLGLQNQTQLAAMFGVTAPNIHQIVHRKIWRSI